MTGPFETERQAHAAAIALGGRPEPGWSILRGPQNRAMLAAACQAAGVTLGAHDQCILGWLGGFEDSTCAVVAGLVLRAAARRDQLAAADRRTVLAALDVAADAKRDAAERCADCDGEPDGGLCGTCEGRLAQADEFDALAERIGGAS